MTRAVASKGPGRLSDSIAATIRGDITRGVLAPGERLPAERELAHKFKTSRLSVREAYRSLEEAGLLTIKRGAGGGAFITRIDHEPVARSLSLILQLGHTTHDQLTEARLLLEPPLARLAAQRATSEETARPEELINEQAVALETHEGPRRLALEFHRLVARSAGNLPLETVMNSLADLTVEAISAIEMSGHVHEHVVVFHRKILDAIRDRDDDRAYELMLLHVGDVQSRLRDDLLRQLQASRKRKTAATSVRRVRGRRER
jgi:GntR family transcriptional regulator, transcriptional repressor for pyruvate dehydrogenase complex